MVIATLRELGKVDTGRTVDLTWICVAANTIAHLALGVLDFDITTESNPAALAAVEKVARRELVARRKLARDLKKPRPQPKPDADDIPHPGTPIDDIPF